MFDETLTIAKALSDRARLRVLMALLPGELCVCQIVELLGLAPSTVSKHLQLLQHSGLIASRKDSRWVYYRLAGREASPAAQKALRWVRDTLAEDSSIGADMKAIKKINGMTKEALCRAQAKR
ncbi:MAG TPA: ArsR family transcriptional regulator [Deltaproteobacteria bacterium]|nr:MAG: hypothetical protein A2Z79_00625 [Deltaproteobacteria bacterium GWA2_55_82]OGQ64883.1 MAG: hypothetical protein A3I81_04735 [Deltaproteobacteria bacterium RIFCSPLOWO2_02_FULL_55_12]OIJ73950.1 MAG: hypothetical protein A2V21_306530 [Deltaproteobacteria bacterium GWC2_55_46]HBG46547.1 ArsR family transcriptional regulator [Deltaproteobacteria bacterium]HCY09949.1 ArsR family transcriptional regulator [Deltaproteobacteria bacterium]